MEASQVSSEARFDRDPTAGRAATERVTFVPSPIADPGPLGLAAFALTTFVLSMFNAKFVGAGGEPIVFGLAFAYGLYAAFAVLSYIFVHRAVRETKGMELEAMTG